MIKISATQKLIGWGCIALIGLVPFHAFATTWLGTTLGYRPLWQAWKEILLGLLAIVALLQLAIAPKSAKRYYKLLPLIILVYTLHSLLITAAMPNPFWPEILGVKSNLGFLLAFMVAYTVSSPKHATFAGKVLVAMAAVVGLFAVFQAFLLPSDFLVQFGYGRSTVPPFIAYGGVLRFPSTLGGANQLGWFLILPIAICLKSFTRSHKLWWGGLLAIMLAASWLSLSRSAWLGTIAAVLIVLAGTLNKKIKTKAIVASIAVILVAVTIGWQIPSIRQVVDRGFLVGGGSDGLHLAAVKSGIEKVNSNPLGCGLGTAGPASFAGQEIFIPENYYLQIAVEAGLIGLGLFLALSYLLGKRLWQERRSASLALPLFATLIGIGVVNLFLHGWSDSSTALSFWTLAGLTLGPSGDSQNV